MGDPEKLRHHLRIEVVHIVGIDLEVAAEHRSLRAGGQGFADEFALGRVPGDGVAPIPRLRGVDEFISQIFLLILDAEAVDGAAAEAAGPAVFVVEPGVHAELVCFVDAGFDAAHPLLRKVGGLKPPARVHEEAADSGVVHLADLFAEHLRLQFLIPAPERNRTVIGRRRGQLKCLFHDKNTLSLRDIVHCHVIKIPSPGVDFNPPEEEFSDEKRPKDGGRGAVCSQSQRSNRTVEQFSRNPVQLARLAGEVERGVSVQEGAARRGKSGRRTRFEFVERPHP